METLEYGKDFKWKHWNTEKILNGNIGIRKRVIKVFEMIWKSKMVDGK